MAAKYKEFYEMMVKQNKETFDEFKKVHDEYLKDPKKWYKEFNKIGSDNGMKILFKFINRKIPGRSKEKFSQNKFYRNGILTNLSRLVFRGDKRLGSGSICRRICSFRPR